MYGPPVDTVFERLVDFCKDITVNYNESSYITQNVVDFTMFSPVKFPLTLESKHLLISGSTDKFVENISDYFQESVRLQTKRLRCGRHLGRTPMSYWTDPRLHCFWIQPMIRDNSPFTAENMRCAIDRAVRKQCDLFSPTVLATLFMFISSRQRVKDYKILDLCAGWGDRLITCLALRASGLDISYTGIDPNQALFKGYADMIDKFGSNAANKFKMINGCAESVVLQTEDIYDMIWAFPPYFNAEVYSLDSTQSSQAYKTVESWREDFLAKSLQNGWNSLKNKGYLVFNLNDIYDSVQDKIVHYTEYALERVSTFNRAVYIGCIYFKTAESSSPQPVFIFYKE